VLSNSLAERILIRSVFIYSLLLFTGLNTPVFAQGNQQMAYYTVNNGLPQSSIDDIIQDKDGFMWIGTAGGLTRFDGYSFKAYRHNRKQVRSAPSDRGYHFYTDQDKRLWMVSYNGLSLYNSAADDFTNIISYEPQRVVTSENHIYGEDGNYIWAGLNDYGMVRVDKKTLKPEKIIIPGLNTSDFVRSWYKGFIENGKLWITTKNDFVIYDIQRKTSKKVSIPVSAVINSGGDMAVGFNEHRVFIINKRNLSFESLLVNSDINILINSVAMKTGNQAFICTTRGLFSIDLSSKKIIQEVSTIGEGTTRKTFTAVKAFNDWSGNLWIGSSDDGIVKITYPHRNFKILRSPNIRNMISTIYADSQKVYVSTSGNGMDIFSRKGEFLKNVTYNNKFNFLTNTATATIPVAGNNLLMLGYNIPSKGHTTPFTYNFSTGTMKILNRSVVDFYNDLWGQGNFRQFAFRLSKDVLITNSGEYLISFTACGNEQYCPAIIHRFTGEMLSCCFRDQEGNLWIGTYKGLFVLKNGKWNAVKLPVPIEIKTINQDKAGNIWAGTSNGIYVLDKKYSLKYTFTEENQLSNEHVYGILRDNNGNMWFSHNKGISVYMRDKKVFRHFFVEDGLQSSEFNSSAYFKTEDGELFFGGINGSTSFYPHEILDNPIAPKVLITNISVFGEPYQSGESYWNRKSLTLPYTENSLSFEFALPEYSNPAKNRYSYFMEGVDKKWINSGDKRFARYPALSHGDYTFKVRAANNDGTWSKEFSTLQIRIVPPFWQRAWFIILGTIAFVLGLTWVISFIQKQKYQKKMQEFEVRQKIQTERERISRDLHDNVGTQLSLINKNIEGILHPLRVIPEAEKEQNLVNVSQTSREVIATLRETIWALNKEEISLEEFSDKLKSFARKQVELYAELELKFTGEIADNSIILSPAEAIHLFRMSQEAIVNCLKYAEASLLQIEISGKLRKYRLSVTDNGKGFDKNSTDITDRYGMQNLKFRANEISCSLKVTSTPGQGTTVSIVKN
jgi:signal transduction histidine kinase/ligand-binding sensor domain-containing protein